MTEPIDTRSERTLWTFPAGSLDAHDSVKGYDVHCSDGGLGTVSWADYKPGESYVDQFEHGMLGGGFVWPYTDV
jgi:hypothetical protein